MPTFERDDIQIYYEEYGQGFPVLLIAPRGIRSAISRFGKARRGIRSSSSHPIIASLRSGKSVAREFAALAPNATLIEY